MRPKAPRQPKGGAADLAAAQTIPRPVVALADSFAKDVVIPAHTHERAQLVFAFRGSITVEADSGLWILPTSHALWIPGGVIHQIRMNGPVEMRSLYVLPDHARGVKPDCQVLFVSPLLRELIDRAIDLPAYYDERGAEGRLMRLILDEVASLPAQPLGLRMPSDARLRRLCDAVLDDLSASARIARVGSRVGLSARSVIRLFPLETGLTFGQWRNQARLLRAFELFAEGDTVTEVAVELGYSTPAAFSKMFRRLMGKPPSAMLPS